MQGRIRGLIRKRTREQLQNLIVCFIFPFVSWRLCGDNHDYSALNLTHKGLKVTSS